MTTLIISSSATLRDVAERNANPEDVAMLTFASGQQPDLTALVHEVANAINERRQEYAESLDMARRCDWDIDTNAKINATYAGRISDLAILLEHAWALREAEQC